MRALSIALLLLTAAPSFGDEHPLLPASDEGPVHSTAPPGRLTTAALILDIAAGGLSVLTASALVSYLTSSFVSAPPLSGPPRHSGDELLPVELGIFTLAVLAGAIALHVLAAHTAP